MNDFGWRLHVDNPLEDVGPPAYVEGSLTLNVTESMLEGHAVHYVTVSWLLTEDREMDQWGGVFVRLINDAAGSGTRGLQEYGYPGLTPAGDACGAALPSETHLCERATIELLITPHRASANYSASMIMMMDVAQNKRSLYFGSGAGMQPAVWMRIINAFEVDDEPPELDLNNVSVSAEPTNPNAPNGETKVTISYWARDDKSGLGLVSYRLLDPQGASHFEYHYHENFYTTFFLGNASARGLSTSSAWCCRREALRAHGGLRASSCPTRSTTIRGTHLWRMCTLSYLVIAGSVPVLAREHCWHAWAPAILSDLLSITTFFYGPIRSGRVSVLPCDYHRSRSA